MADGLSVLDILTPLEIFSGRLLENLAPESPRGQATLPGLTHMGDSSRLRALLVAWVFARNV